MVAKVVSGKKIAGIVYYNEDKVSKGQAVLLMANGFAADADALSLNMKITRFAHLTKLNAAVKTNALHISLNFHAKDRDKGRDFAAIARAYMEGIGFGDQPYLVYQHQDAHHPHLHIVSTNIQRDGSRIDIHGIGYRLSEPVRKSLELQYGLTVAEGRGQKQAIEKIKSAKVQEYGQQAVKKSLTRLVRAVRQDYLYGSLAEFNMVLKSYNATAIAGSAGSQLKEHGGLLYAVLDGKGRPVGVPVKASALGGRPILKQLEKDFVLKQEKRQGLVAGMKAKIDRAWSRNVSSLKGLKKALSKMEVELIVSRTVDGSVFGLTYIDHNSRGVFKGSSLGKDYAATGIARRIRKAEIQHRQQHNKTVSATVNQVKGFIAGFGEVLPSQDISFLFQPGEGQAMASVSGRKRRKKRNQQRGLER